MVIETLISNYNFMCWGFVHLFVPVGTFEPLTTLVHYVFLGFIIFFAGWALILSLIYVVLMFGEWLDNCILFISKTAQIEKSNKEEI